VFFMGHRNQNRYRSRNCCRKFFYVAKQQQWVGKLILSELLV